MTRLRGEALRLIARDPELDRRFRLMLTITGVGETSALQILGELAVPPDMLDARQWVAFSGLDPRLFKSGNTVEKRPRISRGGSRHLRRALYMPALVALRHDPYLRAFYQHLVACGKARLQAGSHADPSCARWTRLPTLFLLLLEQPKKREGSQHLSQREKR